QKTYHEGPTSVIPDRPNSLASRSDSSRRIGRGSWFETRPAGAPHHEARRRMAPARAYRRAAARADPLAGTTARLPIDRLGTAAKACLQARMNEPKTAAELIQQG